MHVQVVVPRRPLAPAVVALIARWRAEHWLRPCDVRDAVAAFTTSADDPHRVAVAVRRLRQVAT